MGVIASVARYVGVATNLASSGAAALQTRVSINVVRVGYGFYAVVWARGGAIDNIVVAVAAAAPLRGLVRLAAL